MAIPTVFTGFWCAGTVLSAVGALVPCPLLPSSPLVTDFATFLEFVSCRCLHGATLCHWPYITVYLNSLSAVCMAQPRVSKSWVLPRLVRSDSMYIYTLYYIAPLEETRIQDASNGASFLRTIATTAYTRRVGFLLAGLGPPSWGHP